MTTAHRRALGTLLSVVVLLAACMPAARPQALAPAAAPAAIRTSTEADIPTLIKQLCDYDWIAADRAGEALAAIGDAAAAALVQELPEGNWVACRPMLMRALAAMPDAAAPILAARLARDSDDDSFNKGLFTLALLQMGQTGLDVIAAAAEGDSADQIGEPVALGALPLIGAASIERLAAIAAQPTATADDRWRILDGLIWLGDEALDEQKIVFSLLSDAEQEDFLSLHLPVGQLDRQAAPLLTAVVSDQVGGEAVTDTVKLAAIQGLGGAGVDPAGAIPALAAIAGSGSFSPPLRAAAIEVLGGYGAAAHPVLGTLQTMLHQGDQQSLQPALVIAMGRIGAGEPAVIEDLLSRGTKCDTPEQAAVTASVAKALGGMGMLPQFTQDETRQPLQDRLLAALEKMLNCPSEEVKLAAIEALGQQGARALPALHKALTSANSPQREQQLSKAFAAVGTDAVPALVARLVNPNATHSAWRVAEGAIELIGAPALPAIVQAWRTGSYRQSRGRLLKAIYAIGPDAFAVLLDLQRQGADTDLERLNTVFMTVTATAAGSLIEPGLATPAALPVLIGAASPITQPLPENEQAVVLIGLIGARAAPATPTLAVLLRSQSDPQFQCQLAEAVRRIGPGAGAAAPALADALAQGSAATCHLGRNGSIEIAHQEQMIKALTALGSQAAPAVPQLTAALAAPELRRQAAEALGAIGAAAHAPLLGLLRTPDSDSDRRRAAAYALRRSSAALDAATALALSDLAQAPGEDENVAAMLAAALAAHGYPVPPALPARGITGLSSRLCPSWPALADSQLVALGYDAYLDACAFQDEPTAPTWRQFVRWLSRVFRR